MPRPEHIATRRPVTRSALARDLRALGVRPADLVMVHASLRSLGWVVGGAQTVVEALLDAAGSEGTVCAQASWEDVPFGLASWPAAWQRAYRAELPPFDRRLSAAAPYVGRLAERIRTWPGSRRSPHPAAGLAAIGQRAAWLTRDHRLDDGFGHGTPYERVCRVGGRVLLLGAPLHRISLLHHAEAIAHAPKAWTTYELRLPGGWRSLREIDVWRGPFPYAETLAPGAEPLGAIAEAALAGGIGTQGRVGEATAHLFGARALVAFAVGWLEARFGEPG
jgi:aminoglycoside 3-N-acetyltransferase